MTVNKTEQTRYLVDHMLNTQCTVLDGSYVGLHVYVYITLGSSSYSGGDK